MGHRGSRGCAGNVLFPDLGGSFTVLEESVLKVAISPPSDL